MSTYTAGLIYGELQAKRARLEAVDAERAALRASIRKLTEDYAVLAPNPTKETHAAPAA